MVEIYPVTEDPGAANTLGLFYKGKVCEQNLHLL
jgi:hypothetical protein